MRSARRNMEKDTDDTGWLASSDKLRSTGQRRD